MDCGNGKAIYLNYYNPAASTVIIGPLTVTGTFTAPNTGRACVNFNGNNATIRASGNVSSISYYSTG